MKYRVFNNFFSVKNRFEILEYLGENGYREKQVKFAYSPFKTYSGVDQDDGYGFQFVSEIFDREGIRDQYAFELLFPVLAFFNSSSIIRIKINANPKTHVPSQELFHIDHNSTSPFLTAVYYVNENNGGTQIKDGPFIRSVANRLLIFDGKLQHAGVTATDVKTRFVVNFNFYSSRGDDIFNLPNYPSTILD